MADKFRDPIRPGGGYPPNDRARDSAYETRNDDRQAYPDTPSGQGRAETDPLAELARLIGQTDPFANFGRDASAPPPQQSGQHVPHIESQDQVYWADDAQDANSGNRFEPPWNAPADAGRSDTFDPHAHEQSYRGFHEQGADYSAAPPEDLSPPPPFLFSNDKSARPGHTPRPETAYRDAGQADPVHDPYSRSEPAADRYDNVLYGADPQAASDPYAGDHDAYGDVTEGDYAPGYEGVHEAPRRRSGMFAVIVVFGLAVIGTAGAFAYRSLIVPHRSGPPPVIKADAGPSKIVPPKQTTMPGGKQIFDRVAAAGTSERLVPREEQPVDVQQSIAPQPRNVFPPPNSQASAPPTAAAPRAPTDGTEPRRIRTVTIRPDQPDGVPNSSPQPSAAPAAAPQAMPQVAKPAPSPAQATAARGNDGSGPMQLSPQAQPPKAPARVAARATPAAAPVSGGYLVQVSSQRSDADARNSFRTLQHKYASVLGGKSLVVKKADLGERGTYYRAMVGPFASQDAASQLCSKLKAAGGQCVVQRN